MPYDLAELRRRHKLTQRELAKALGVSPSMIGNIEAGIGGVSLRMARKIARFFNVPLDDLRFPYEERTQHDGEEQRLGRDCQSREEAAS
mgnify:CR=1 FL=1